MNPDTPRPVIAGDGRGTMALVLTLCGGLIFALLVLAIIFIEPLVEPLLPQPRHGPAGVEGNPAQFFGPDNYPPAALRANEQGRTVAKLTIGRDGAVSRCWVAQTSGSTALDSATCSIALHRVHFEPALDRDDRPIESSYTLPVRWVLPVESVVTRSDEVIFSGDGDQISCTAKVDGERRELPSDTCRGLAESVQASGHQLNRDTIIPTTAGR